MSRQTPRPYRMDARAAAAQATRDRILDIAYTQFLERWYDEVTLRDLAKEAGVALQTVVNHFGTKENLFFAVAERFSAMIAETRGGVLPDDIAGAAAALVADYEQTGDTNLRMLALEERVPAVAEGLASGRRSHREWVERIFPSCPVRPSGCAPPALPRRASDDHRRSHMEAAASRPRAEPGSDRGRDPRVARGSTRTPQGEMT